MQREEEEEAGNETETKYCHYFDDVIVGALSAI